MNVSSYYFVKSKIAQKWVKIFFVKKSPKEIWAVCNFYAVFGFSRPRTSCVP